MTSLLGIHSLAKSYGTKQLFHDISFTVHSGDRIGLVGPNGCGKSTLLKILMGLETADEGTISRRQNLRIGYASQSPEFGSHTLLETLLQQPAAKGTGDVFELETRARTLLSRAGFENHETIAETLSGGWKKRLDIARVLMLEPDLLLLDEPTNHLDLEGILWLEKLLQKERVGYLVVSHDRYFLENISTKVIELNRCYPEGIFTSEGTMSDFMENKAAFLEGQLQQQQGLASIVRDEIEWLRKSPKARTTKSRSRVQKAHELIEELSQIQKRNQTIKVDIDFSASERDTRKLIATKNLTKSLGGKLLFEGVDLILSPGTRLGIAGKNGTGKTTLLRILAGKITHDSGTIKYAENLKLVYFDQHREHINPEHTLKEALCPSGEYVDYRGQSIHVHGWAKKFLFPTERLALPVRYLSGGERARILIARLMLEPADVLFLDEPTNDLDIATLEVIEESLKEFAGAVVLISHDRCLMDNVCTEILGLGEANEHQIFADYTQWEKSFTAAAPKKKEEEKPKVVAAKVTSSKKLSYKEQKELEGMESAIMACEEEIEKLQRMLESPEVMASATQSLEYYKSLGSAEQKRDALFMRWQELENFSK